MVSSSNPEIFNPITSEAFLFELKNLGIKKGMPLLVISSKNFSKQIIGGSHAVVETLLNSVGTEGTIIMEAFNILNSEPSFWKRPVIPQHFLKSMREFMPVSNVYYDDVASEIVDNFRKRPKVVYSFHPRFSYLAVGKLAKAITTGRKLNYAFGHTSPLQRLYELNGSVLFLGKRVNQSTALYLAQYHSGKFPKILQGAKVSLGIENKWQKYLELRHHHRYDEKLVVELINHKLLKVSELNQQTIALANMRNFSDYARDYYLKNI